jgi:hypothetical protein
MKLIELISAKQNNRAWQGQPEWECLVRTEDGLVLSKPRHVQWNQPQLHHLQDEFDRFASTFTQVASAS